jgi:hypothetical protein
MSRLTLQLREAAARMLAAEDQIEAEMRERAMSVAEFHTEAPERFEAFERAVEEVEDLIADLESRWTDV